MSYKESEKHKSVAESKARHSDASFKAGRGVAGFRLAGGSLLVFLMFVALFQYIAVKEWGFTGSTFLATYPDGSGLVYFNVFGYLKNLSETFSHNSKALFNAFPEQPVSPDVSWDIIGWVKYGFAWFFFILDCGFIPLKIVVIFPLQVIKSFLGFYITDSFGSFLDFLMGLMIPTRF